MKKLNHRKEEIAIVPKISLSRMIRKQEKGWRNKTFYYYLKKKTKRLLLKRGQIKSSIIISEKLIINYINIFMVKNSSQNLYFLNGLDVYWLEISTVLVY
jgi:hypothetical protein